MKTKQSKTTVKTAAMMVIAALVGVLSLADYATADSQWPYEYEDDFNTAKAKRDSYDHSVFWPENAFPPDRPYLVFSSRFGIPPSGPRGLLFIGHRGRPAHLDYCFPIVTASEPGPVMGVLEFDLRFANNTDSFDADGVRGHLSFSVSGNGEHWSDPAALHGGHQEIKLASRQGTCYVSLRGSRALIDNLHVLLRPEDPDPDILHVPGEYETIQAAVDAAEDGQTVEVAAGVYDGPGNRDIELLGKAITVRSAAGAEHTVIFCGPDDSSGTQVGHRGFYIHQGEGRRTVIKGFTILEGKIIGCEIPPDNMRWNLNPNHPIGAGIYCEFSSPTIADCVLVNCSAELGAGIGCVGGRPLIVGCRVIGCQAGGLGACESGGRGGGIGLIRHCRASIINCELIGNNGYYNSFGGGLYSRRSSAKVLNCRISGNGADGNIDGGGIYCGPGSDMLVENCLIYNNTANLGAGICAESMPWHILDANEPPELGMCDLLVKNCTVAHNYLKYPMPVYPGAGIHSNRAHIRVRNCIAWYNEPTQIVIYRSPCKSPVTFCDVEGSYPSPLWSYPANTQAKQYTGLFSLEESGAIDDIDTGFGAGNIDADPCFARPLLPWPDYHLKSIFGRYVPGPAPEPSTEARPGHWVRDEVHSPCIDAGDPRDPVGREPLPNGHRINMGAYGGTRQASMGRVRVFDPGVWGIGGYEDQTDDPDIDNDGTVNLSDFARLADYWLQGQQVEAPLPDEE